MVRLGGSLTLIVITGCAAPAESTSSEGDSSAAPVSTLAPNTSEVLLPPDPVPTENSLEPAIDDDAAITATVPATGWPGPRWSARIDSNGRGLCWIDPNRTVRCVGDGSSTDPPAGEFRQVSMGWREICGIRRDGTIGCTENGSLAAGVPPGTFASVVVDEDFACALGADGMAQCWGAAETPSSLQVPTAQFAQIALGLGAGCGITLNGQILCWGDNPFATSDANRLVPDRSDYVSVAMGGANCGLFGQGQVGCWTTYDDAPPGEGYVAVSTATGLVCALHADGFANCTGTSAENWIDSVDDIPRPDVPLRDLAASADWVCGVTDANLLACWGEGLPLSFTQGSIPVISLAALADVDPCDDDPTYIAVEGASSPASDTIQGSIVDDPLMPTCTGYEDGLSIFKLQGHVHGHAVDFAAQSSSQLAGGRYRASGLEVQAAGNPTNMPSAIESGTLVLAESQPLAGTTFLVTAGELLTTTLAEGLSVSFRISGLRQDKGGNCPTPALPVALRGCQYRGP